MRHKLRAGRATGTCGEKSAIASSTSGISDEIVQFVFFSADAAPFPPGKEISFRSMDGSGGQDIEGTFVYAVQRYVSRQRLTTLPQ